MRKWSHIMERALDAALDIQPEDKPPIPGPRFRAGQIVAVYTDSAHGLFIAYGRIVTGTWECEQYFYAIRTLADTLISHPEQSLRAISPEEQRQLWIVSARKT